MTSSRPSSKLPSRHPPGPAAALRGARPGGPVPAAPPSQGPAPARCQACPALSGGACPAGAAGCSSPGQTAPWPARAGLALAAGVAGAVVYEAQPLLAAVDRSLRSGSGPAGLLSALPQLGLALGLVLLVPLAAETGGGRARLASQVGGALLAGAVLSRTLSGVVGGLAGWRASFWLPAALLAVAAVVSLAYLPPSRPLPSAAPYRQMLATVTRSLSGLERQAVYGALAFGSFGAAWTALPFLLGGGRWRLGPELIGVVGLTGVAGLAGGSVLTRLVRPSGGSASMGAFATLAVAGWALLEVGGRSLPALVAGLVLLDAAVQAMHLANREGVERGSGCSAAPAATAYMALALLGGALGSALSGAVWSWAGWPAACGVGLALAGAALALWLVDMVRTPAGLGPSPVRRP